MHRTRTSFSHTPSPAFLPLTAMITPIDIISCKCQQHQQTINHRPTTAHECRHSPVLLGQATSEPRQGPHSGPPAPPVATPGATVAHPKGRLPRGIRRRHLGIACFLQAASAGARSAVATTGPVQTAVTAGARSVPTRTTSAEGSPRGH